MQDPGKAQPGELAKHDAERLQECLALPACSWATALSQGVSYKLLPKFPYLRLSSVPHPCLLGGWECPIRVTDPNGTAGRSARTKNFTTYTLHTYTKLLEFFYNVCINFFLHKRFHSESFEKCWPTITDNAHMENAAILRVKNVSCLTLHSNNTNQDGKHIELELQGNFRHKT